MSVIWTFSFGAIPYNTGTKYFKYIIVYDSKFYTPDQAGTHLVTCVLCQIMNMGVPTCWYYNTTEHNYSSHNLSNNQANFKVNGS